MNGAEGRRAGDLTPGDVHAAALFLTYRPESVQWVYTRAEAEAIYAELIRLGGRHAHRVYLERGAGGYWVGIAPETP